MPSSDHKCFGCQTQISDMEPHIHLTLDGWAVANGLEPGLEPCPSCTEIRGGLGL